MGIFGHKDQTHTTEAGRFNQSTTGAGVERTGLHSTGLHDTGHSTVTGGVASGGMGTGTYGNSGYEPGPTTGQGFDTAGPGTGGRTAAGAGGHDQYATGGGGYGQEGIPAANNLSHRPNERHSGSSQRMTGKVEEAVGSMVGSNALKAKGLQKQQEANNIKNQSQELAEAERLEREAALRRERAVAHGAHPDNAHPAPTNTRF